MSEPISILLGGNDMNDFREIKPEEINKNTFSLIGNEWMLITAENKGRLNTMTASWGGFGVMWEKNVVFVVIRPSRYTKEFVDNSDSFSLTFFDKDFKKQLGYLGSVSGRDEDKIAKLNLTVGYSDETPYFTNANLAVFCKKLYAQEYNPECFIDKSLTEECYPEGDYHTLYIAEISKVFIRK